MSSTRTDERGRLYLPKGLREEYGTRYRIVGLEDGIKLIPIREDVFDGLRDALGELPDVSGEERSTAAEDEARREALDDLG